MTDKEIKIIEIGTYNVPPILAELESFILKNDLYTLFGFMISFNCRYNVTPLDVIPFARTGGAGIHFGFLTEFGLIKTLDNAQIVIVAPTDDPPIRIVANNLSEFLSYFPTIFDAEDLLLNDIKDWERRNNERWDIYDEDEIVKEKVIFSNLVTEFEQQFGFNKFETGEAIFTNMKKIRDSRKIKITIDTVDDIGIVYYDDDNIIDTFDYSISDVEKIEKYLQNCNKLSRIKFYKDSTYMYILSKEYDYQVLLLLKNWLNFDGFNREAQVISLLE